MAFGGPVDFDGRNLEASHIKMKINDIHFDIFRDLLI